ncbi:MAG: alpha/beta fold hydrolase [Ferruginibacter sp.]
MKYSIFTIMKKNIQYQNTSVHYSMYGKGNPVMLVHGFAEESSVFNDQVNHLKENFLVIVPDLPGIGKSEMLQKENVSLVDYADILKAMIDKENITGLTLIGHSMGGYITMAFAEKYPTMLNGLGLFHSSAYADDAEKIAVRKKAIEFIKENGTAAFLKTTIPGLFFNVDESQKAIDDLIEIGNSFAPEVLVQQYNAMINRKDTTAVLSTFAKPILFIMGEHDKAVPIAQTLQQSHLPQIAYVHILRRTAHMGMIEEPMLVNNYLADFLQSV